MLRDVMAGLEKHRAGHRGSETAHMFRIDAVELFQIL